MFSTSRAGPGNPVLSVYQTDVICYGANLLDWLDRERNGWSSKPWEGVHIKKIPFWLDALGENGAMPQTPIVDAKSPSSQS